MWQHKSTAERLDDIERWFARLFGADIKGDTERLTASLPKA